MSRTMEEFVSTLINHRDMGDVPKQKTSERSLNGAALTSRLVHRCATVLLR